MMGEYVFYYKGKVFGGIYDDRFLVKPIKAAVELMPDAESEFLYEGGKGMLLVDSDDRDFVKDLVEAMYDELPAPKKRDRKVRMDEGNRALELIALMADVGLKGSYKAQTAIDGVRYDVVWEKSDNVKFGIGFYWHGGDDVIYLKYTQNGEDILDHRIELWTNTNEELMNELKDLNDDDYVVIRIGLFGKKHKFIVDDKNIDKYKSKKKYDIQEL